MLSTVTVSLSLPKNFFVTTSAVSKQLKNLEEALGIVYLLVTAKSYN